MQVVNPAEPGPQLRLCPSTTDWNLCLICQEVKDEPLKCPSTCIRGRGGVAYKTMAENLQSFSDINCLPSNLQLARLDEGEGIEATFRQRDAKWHDSCRLKFNCTKLKRAEKRKEEVTLHSIFLKGYYSNHASSLMHLLGDKCTCLQIHAHTKPCRKIDMAM